VHPCKMVIGSFFPSAFGPLNEHFRIVILEEFMRNWIISVLLISIQKKTLTWRAWISAWITYIIGLPVIPHHNQKKILTYSLY